MRVLTGGLFHETNTFLEGIAGIEDFAEQLGERIFDTAGDGSPMDGVLEEAHRCGWTVLPTIDLRATPGPVVSDAVMRRFIQQLEAAVIRERDEGIDAILLVLHGAMVSETCEDVEGTVLSRLRSLTGIKVRIGAVLDLHANCTPQMAFAADLLLAYRENPHSDGKACGMRAVQLMDRLLREDLRARCFLRNVPVLWPPTGTATANEPMASLECMARSIEHQHPEILAMNVMSGFAFSDVHWAGVSFCCVSTGAEDEAATYLNLLEERALELREQGNCVEQNLDRVFDDLETRTGGPHLLVEPADNIGAGTSGRGLAVLAGFLKRGIENAAVAIQAPQQVAVLASVPIGNPVSLRLEDPFAGDKLEVHGILESRSDGKFVLEDPLSHLASMGGCNADMGPCAVVRTSGVQILLTSKRTPPFDLGQFRSQGIIPERLFAVGIKAAVAHRRAWDPIAAKSDWVDVPGPCSSRLKRLPFQRLRRPIFPLDFE